MIKNCTGSIHPHTTYKVPIKLLLATVMTAGIAGMEEPIGPMQAESSCGSGRPAAQSLVASNPLESVHPGNDDGPSNRDRLNLYGLVGSGLWQEFKSARAALLQAQARATSKVSASATEVFLSSMPGRDSVVMGAAFSMTSTPSSGASASQSPDAPQQLAQNDEPSELERCTTDLGHALHRLVKITNKMLLYGDFTQYTPALRAFVRFSEVCNQSNDPDILRLRSALTEPVKRVADLLPQMYVPPERLADLLPQMYVRTEAQLNNFLPDSRTDNTLPDIQSVSRLILTNLGEIMNNGPDMGNGPDTMIHTLTSDAFPKLIEQMHYRMTALQPGFALCLCNMFASESLDLLNTTRSTDIRIMDELICLLDAFAYQSTGSGGGIYKPAPKPTPTQPGINARFSALLHKDPQLAALIAALPSGLLLLLFALHWITISQPGESLT